MKKKASQSSTLYWAKQSDRYFYWNASYAVDGEKENLKRQNSFVEQHAYCSGTNQDPWPSWWLVDLGAVFAITRVEVYGRATEPPGNFSIFTFPIIFFSVNWFLFI